jgi:hypothetical protein
MKRFKERLDEAAVRVTLSPASRADENKLRKILDGAGVSYKQDKKGEKYAIIFDDKLQKQVVMSAINNDRKIKFK